MAHAGKNKTTKTGEVAAEAITAKKHIRTIADMRQDEDLWFRTRVLVHDLCHFAKDKNAQERLSQTTDAQYLSMPYYSDEQVAVVKAALVEVDGTSIAMEQAITERLQDFFEKRKASGDFRPCGAHTMAPIYLLCFGLEKAEIEDRKLLSRLRKSGLS